jgi:hypothetical protein
VIYDYFSVVVCECQLDPISVPSCPRSPHDWSLKAKDICTMKTLRENSLRLAWTNSEWVIVV